jgi:hypothetical protein
MTLAPFTAFCYGVAFTGAVGAAMFFFRFWRISRDPFFAWFTAAFALLAFQWLALVGANPDAEARPYYYLLRLAAFVLIIAAAAQKNRRRERKEARSERANAPLSRRWTT